MPPLVTFIVTRLAIGFLLGATAGFVVWIKSIAPVSPSYSYVAQGMFIYQFASTIGVCYLATALMFDER
ncbi:hypothetical protein ACC689_07810 [Rhizobium ruizarguesonis]|nr:hypothetical protein [Rhizobium leguminosarum]TBZ40486.1 hypothetical protein E0H44_24470 [Rhizobium leguminosarum bv. viciae]TCA06463.1 hypothetical protein E0H68_31120 [Rhizobium leguminosarum bv. viciae]TCA19678.1 hypothetical protein E0H67_25905 [Rhizobium leguminosarum bv. viciae]